MAKKCGMDEICQSLIKFVSKPVQLQPKIGGILVGADDQIVKFRFELANEGEPAYEFRLIFNFPSNFRFYYAKNPLDNIKYTCESEKTNYDKQHVDYIQFSQQLSCFIANPLHRSSDPTNIEILFKIYEFLDVPEQFISMKYSISNDKGRQLKQW